MAEERELQQLADDGCPHFPEESPVYGLSPLLPFYRLIREIHAQADRIAELEKENAKLREELLDWECWRRGMLL